MKKFELLLLALLFVAALTVRLYKIDRPIADWHSWRQADTAAVSRNFIKDGFNPFIPKFDDMSSQANSIDNPNRYRFVEFPIYNLIVAGVWKITGVETVYARLVTVVVSLLSTLFLYLTVRKLSGSKTAFLAAFFFSFIPYNVFYSSVILPGPFMVFATLAMYFFFIKFLENENNFYFIISAFFASIALLSWPISIFFFLPLIYLVFDKYKIAFIKKFKLWIFVLIAFVPFLAWRIWILNFPAGIPNWAFLLNEGGIRFKGAFFRWIISERLGGLILGTTGFSLFSIGLIRKFYKENIFYFLLLASSIIYLTVFASGNVRHDYYQVAIIPTLAIFMGLGAVFILESKLINKIFGYALLTFLVLFSFTLSFYEIRGFYWINKPEIVEAGAAADAILPRDALVIAPYNGDVAFLYQTNRRGYPVVDRPISKLIEVGAKYLVSVDPNDSGIKKLSDNCKTLKKTEKFVIIELTTTCIEG